MGLQLVLGKSKITVTGPAFVVVYVFGDPVALLLE
nr:MAG TPA: hypothetical protein [Caudoviricetes sp.]